jgi:co-chaperonin GroES (HSP10)
MLPVMEDPAMAQPSERRLFVVGDRVLVTPEKGEERTRVGLYLPATAVESAPVQGGRIVEVGPGTPVPSPSDVHEEPWKIGEPRAQYVPLEAKPGDFALFLRKAAIEVQFDGTDYLIVPHGAILLLVREPAIAEESPEFDPADFDL